MNKPLSERQLQRRADYAKLLGSCKVPQHITIAPNQPVKRWTVTMGFSPTNL